jgi:hypothetical protein
LFKEGTVPKNTSKRFLRFSNTSMIRIPLMILSICRISKRILSSFPTISKNIVAQQAIVPIKLRIIHGFENEVFEENICKIIYSVNTQFANASKFNDNALSKFK